MHYELCIMNTLNVKHLHIVPEPEAADIPALLDKAGVGFEKIAHAPWANDYPYQPEVKFRIAATNNAFLIHYVVSEEHVAAVADADNGHVWEDSCCEFFCQPADDGIYYNIECNCMGTVLMAYGPSRDNRITAPKEVLKNIKRWTSLSSVVGSTLPLQRIAVPWQLALVVPFTAFFHHNIKNMEGHSVKANFYKCGDNLPKPHFLAWNDIALPRPDFHRPDFFGQMIIE